MMSNYLHLTNKDLDKPIYRIFSKKRLFEVFETKKLVLVQPKLWDDPFENFIMNSKGELNGGQLFDINFRENFYGQCWTYRKENDALWRIYAPDKDGIKVKTTVRRLFESLYSNGGKFRDISCFIGKVKYFKKKEMIKFLEDGKNISRLITDTSGKGQASTLLFKRVAFNHEKEVRLIYYSPVKLNSDKYYLPVDPTELFDEITIDPRAKYNDFKNWKEKLETLGFRKKIIRSLLYKIPNLKFKFVK